jgi:hypothetical protein
VSAVSVSTIGSAPRRRGARQRSPHVPRMAWIPEGDLEYPEWVAVGRSLGALGRGTQWWVGDWLLYGASRGIWGEKYAEASRITGYDVGSLRNMASLAAQFELSRRRDNLTWCHHAAVASLGLEEQDHWLDRAAAEGLSVADLRELRRSWREREVAGVGVSKPATTPCAVEVVTCPYCGGDVPLPPGDAHVNVASINGARPVAVMQSNDRAQTQI